MSLDVTIMVEPGYVRIIGVGEFEPEKMFEFIAFVKKTADSVNRERVFMDCSLMEGKMTEAERFQGGVRIAEVFGPELKAALLMPVGLVTKLGELTAVNRGARFFVTDSETEALDWLLGTVG